MRTATTKYRAYWRENHKSRPYTNNATAFAGYEPAHSFGVASDTKYRGRSFEDVESDLARDWNASRVTSNLAWDRARFAARDAWDRVRTRR